MLNEACNEAEKASVLLPAALMSEHKDHQQDGNNRRAAGVNQQHSVYLFTTCDGHTEYFSFVLQIFFSFFLMFRKSVFVTASNPKVKQSVLKVKKHKDPLLT